MVRQCGLNAMIEQDAAHIGCETDLAAHKLDVHCRQLSVKRLVDTEAVDNVMPIRTDMGFKRSDLIPTKSDWPRPIRAQSMWSEELPSSQVNWAEGISGSAFGLSKTWTNPTSSSSDPTSCATSSFRLTSTMG